MTPHPAPFPKPHMASPLPVGVIHFIGIGGIGMSGIAEILHNLGWKVQGSDQTAGGNVQRLQAMGVKVAIGHRAENLGEAAVVVYSSAVKPDNPEMVAARTQRLPVVRRAEMLAELMRLKWSVAVAGTHGKTTTTSITAALFEAAGMDPTIVNGGIINALGSNARLGAGDWMVVEADESDGSFMRLPATVAIVTNMDPEHMEHYGEFARVRDAYATFVTNIPFYGFGVVCLDHPEVAALLPRLADRRIITYGFSPQADVRAVDMLCDAAGSSFSVQVSAAVTGDTFTLPHMHLPMIGPHNVQNSLAALATGLALGFPADALRKGLAQFKGVKRRFTLAGVVDDITIIDDYGHHPVEITAVLNAARLATPPGSALIAVVQPHRYTRLHDLFDGFCTCLMEADRVLVADVYAAGESAIDGASASALVESMAARGHRAAEHLSDPAQLAARIHAQAKPGDLVVCLGAGSITQWAHALPEQLAALRGSKVRTAS